MKVNLNNKEVDALCFAYNCVKIQKKLFDFEDSRICEYYGKNLLLIQKVINKANPTINLKVTK